MYVFVSMRIGAVVVSGWLSHSYMMLFNRKGDEPIDVRAFLKGQRHENPYKISNTTTFSWGDLSRLLIRFEMLDETGDDKSTRIEVKEMVMREYTEARKGAEKDEDSESSDD